MTPQTKALTASLATSPAREGASCDRIPIWIPSEPMLPKPHKAHIQKIRVARYTKQESDGVEHVPGNEIKRQGRRVDVEEASPPRQQAVNETNEGKNAEQRSHDTASNLDTEPGAVRKGVDGVGSGVLLIIRNDDLAGREGLLNFRIAELGDGKGCGDGHDARRHHGLRIEAETDVSDEHRAGNGGETTRQNLVQLRIGHVRHKGANEKSRLALADKGSGGSNDSLGARHLKSPEDEGGHLADEPLQEPDVVEDLDNGDEEDDGRQNVDDEVAELVHLVEITGSISDELEDVVAGAGSQDEEGDDELRKHATDDGAPVDHLAVARGTPESEDGESQTKQRHGTVLAVVVGKLLRSHRSDKHGGHGDGTSSGSTSLGRESIVNTDSALRPGPDDGAGQVRAADVEEEEAHGDGKPHQEGDAPVHVVAVQNEACNPPASKQQEDEQVEKGAVTAVKGARLGRLVLRRALVIVGNDANLLAIGILGRALTTKLGLLDIVLAAGARVVVMVQVALGRNGLRTGALGVHDVVFRNAGGVVE
ncbi:hypothetical protein BN1708_007695, partial [Verticillium longisporum]